MKRDLMILFGGFLAGAILMGSVTVATWTWPQNLPRMEILEGGSTDDLPEGWASA